MNVFHFKILCLYLDTNINLDIQIYALFIQKMIWQGTNQTVNRRGWDGRGISRGNLNFLLYIYIYASILKRHVLFQKLIKVCIMNSFSCPLKYLSPFLIVLLKFVPLFNYVIFQIV